MHSSCSHFSLNASSNSRIVSMSWWGTVLAFASIAAVCINNGVKTELLRVAVIGKAPRYSQGITSKMDVGRVTELVFVDVS